MCIVFRCPATEEQLNIVFICPTAGEQFTIIFSCPAVYEQLNTIFICPAAKHLHAQTVRARDLKLFNTCRMSGVRCHVSDVICQVLDARCQMSHVNFFYKAVKLVG